ncbi:MAG: hypothetical protein M1820_002067 [Bogoriella megaspora]|nr:MAG: hypothetical protein M1820_002067 [Bogoriella megaspora]
MAMATLRLPLTPPRTPERHAGPRQTTGQMTRFWDPESVLKISNPEHRNEATCPCIAPTTGKRCKKQADKFNVAIAKEKVEQLAFIDPGIRNMRPQLEEIIKLLLCKGIHRKIPEKFDEVIRDWTEQVQHAAGSSSFTDSVASGFDLRELPSVPTGLPITPRNVSQTSLAVAEAERDRLRDTVASVEDTARQLRRELDAERQSSVERSESARVQQREVQMRHERELRSRRREEADRETRHQDELSRQSALADREAGERRNLEALVDQEASRRRDLETELNTLRTTNETRHRDELRERSALADREASRRRGLEAELQALRAAQEERVREISARSSETQAELQLVREQLQQSNQSLVARREASLQQGAEHRQVRQALEAEEAAHRTLQEEFRHMADQYDRLYASHHELQDNHSALRESHGTIERELQRMWREGSEEPTEIVASRPSRTRRLWNRAVRAARS